MPSETPLPIAFKAETRQLLDILIHSLYTEREIFLRELISNASDALTRMDFELLTNREVLDPEAPLSIRIQTDSEANTITIEDTGIGMTSAELAENLGTIAHSGARAFFEAVKQTGQKASDLIGQFGVGFYSAFMVAEWIRVTSRTYQKDGQAASWFCTGADSFTIEPADREKRGTQILIQLKEDAREFSQESHLREIIGRHSDFIPYPIYLGSSDVQINRQTAIWRQSPREVEQKAYDEFYQQITLDFEPPLAHAHMAVDAPVQMYALLYIPSSPERSIFSLRREEGLRLFAHKVLIQEYNRSLLPEYLWFVQGVVDSEDIPLNVSRESIQSNRLLTNMKKLVTSKVIDTLKKLGEEDPEKYALFWKNFSRFIKQGVAVEQSEPESLYPLLRFHTTNERERWLSLADYVQGMLPGQEKIYYLLGDDESSVMFSPHLDPIRKAGYPVLLMTDPLDAFVLTRLKEFQSHPLTNIASADLDLPGEEEKEGQESAPRSEDSAALIERFKNQLGDQISDVRISIRLNDSPARLVDPEGAPGPEMQRVYRMLEREFSAPKKVLELNPNHPILVDLAKLPASDPISNLLVDQIYEDALLVEGLHPNPASMIERIQKIMQAAVSGQSQPDE